MNQYHNLQNNLTVAVLTASKAKAQSKTSISSKKKILKRKNQSIQEPMTSHSKETVQVTVQETTLTSHP